MGSFLSLGFPGWAFTRLRCLSAKLAALVDLHFSRFAAIWHLFVILKWRVIEPWIFTSGAFPLELVNRSLELKWECGETRVATHRSCLLLQSKVTFSGLVEVCRGPCELCCISRPFKINYLSKVTCVTSLGWRVPWSWFRCGLATDQTSDCPQDLERCSGDLLTSPHRQEVMAQLSTHPLSHSLRPAAKCNRHIWVIFHPLTHQCSSPLISAISLPGTLCS